MPKPRSRLALIYRSPTGAVAAYDEFGERVICERQRNLISMAYWRKYSGVIPAFDNAEWMEREREESVLCN